MLLIKGNQSFDKSNVYRSFLCMQKLTSKKVASHLPTCLTLVEVLAPTTPISFITSEVWLDVLAISVSVPL